MRQRMWGGYIGVAACVAVIGSGGAGTADAQCERDKILARDGVEGDVFGISVALDGNRALIGAHGADDRAGAAYVYEFDGRKWTERQRIQASDFRRQALFGHSVALDGDRLVVGAPWDSDNGTLAGAAYAYRFDSNQWGDEAKLMASDGFAFEFFGNAVALSGDFAMFGDDHDGDNGPESGSVYVFQTEGTTWTEVDKLLPSDGDAFDWFGFSLSMSGDVAVIGARSDDENGRESGSAYVFRFDGQSWRQEQKLLPSDPSTGARFGNSVAVDADTILIGANLDPENGRQAGAAYVFEFDGRRWVERRKLLASDPGKKGWFGVAVALSGDRALVGAFLTKLSGAAYLFERNDGRWTQTAKLVATETEPGDQFGFGRSLSGATALIGAHGEDDLGDESGAAYAFDLSGPACGGRERLSVRCKRQGGGQGDRLQVKIKRGRGARSLVARVDGDPETDVIVNLTCDGRGAGRIKNIAPGAHTVELVGCTDPQAIDCP